MAGKKKKGKKQEGKGTGEDTSAHSPSETRSGKQYQPHSNEDEDEQQGTRVPQSGLLSLVFSAMGNKKAETKESKKEGAGSTRSGKNYQPVQSAGAAEHRRRDAISRASAAFSWASGH